MSRRFISTPCKCVPHRLMKCADYSTRSPLTDRVCELGPAVGASLDHFPLSSVARCTSAALPIRPMALPPPIPPHHHPADPADVADGALEQRPPPGAASDGIVDDHVRRILRAKALVTGVVELTAQGASVPPEQLTEMLGAVAAATEAATVPGQRLMSLTDAELVGLCVALPRHQLPVSGVGASNSDIALNAGADLLARMQRCDLCQIKELIRPFDAGCNYVSFLTGVLLPLCPVLELDIASHAASEKVKPDVEALTTPAALELAMRLGSRSRRLSALLLRVLSCSETRRCETITLFSTEPDRREQLLPLLEIFSTTEELASAPILEDTGRGVLVGALVQLTMKHCMTNAARVARAFVVLVAFGCCKAAVMLHVSRADAFKPGTMTDEQWARVARLLVTDGRRCHVLLSNRALISQLVALGVSLSPTLPLTGVASLIRLLLECDSRKLDLVTPRVQALDAAELRVLDLLSVRRQPNRRPSASSEYDDAKEDQDADQITFSRRSELVASILESLMLLGVMHRANDQRGAAHEQSTSGIENLWKRCHALGRPLASTPSQETGDFATRLDASHPVAARKLRRIVRTLIDRVLEATSPVRHAWLRVRVIDALCALPADFVNEQLAERHIGELENFALVEEVLTSVTHQQRCSLDAEAFHGLMAEQQACVITAAMVYLRFILYVGSTNKASVTSILDTLYGHVAALTPQHIVFLLRIMITTDVAHKAMLQTLLDSLQELDAEVFGELEADELMVTISAIAANGSLEADRTLVKRIIDRCCSIALSLELPSGS